MTPGGMSTEQRLRSALEHIVARSQRTQDSWQPRTVYPSEYAKAWHDGYTTALSTASLIAYEALDPESWTESQKNAVIATHGTDREWFERTGNCGHCGNLGSECCCPADDPCQCGPHDLRTEPVPCWLCKGEGVRQPPAVATA